MPLHNVEFIVRLVDNIRASVRRTVLPEYRDEFRGRLRRSGLRGLHVANHPRGDGDDERFDGGFQMKPAMT